VDDTGRTTDSVLRLVIRGRVQGVGYRWAMVEQARRADLRGWVRNRRDGTVEAIVAGAPDALERLVAWARRGPDGALVSAVEVAAAEPQVARDCIGFEQRPTA